MTGERFIPFRKSDVVTMCADEVSPEERQPFLAFVELAFWFGVRREPVQLDQGQLVALGARLAAIGGFLVRQFGKFKNRKIQFMKSLSDNLYFRNLDNDAGVFHHLLDAAEEEETKEAVLAYTSCVMPGTGSPPTSWISGSRRGSCSGGTPSSTSRSPTAWASCAGCA